MSAKHFVIEVFESQQIQAVTEITLAETHGGRPSSIREFKMHALKTIDVKKTFQKKNKKTLKKRKKRDKNKKNVCKR